MASTHTDDLRLAHVLADDADSLTMERFRAADLHVSTKPDTTLVTDADSACEEALRRTLGRARPRDAVLGEEEGSTGWGPRRWVIDPIDGTHELRPRRPGLGHPDRADGGRRGRRGLRVRPGARPALVGLAGGGAWTGKSLMSAKPCRVSDVAEIEDASFSYAELTGGSGSAGSTTCWR